MCPRQLGHSRTLSILSWVTFQPVLIRSKLIRSTLFSIFRAKIWAPSMAGRQRDGTSMLVMKFSSNTLNKGIPKDTNLAA